MAEQQTLLLSFVIVFCLQTLSRQQVDGFEYNLAWSVPRPDDTEIYNLWASHNRFHLGDTIRFKYVRDSVLEVSEQDYVTCKSSHPNLFSNSGDTVIELDRHGSFFFISGVSRHCEKGQRIIIKVKDLPGNSTSDGRNSSVADPLFARPIGLVFMVFSSFVASIVI